MNGPLVVIVGETASGKSSLAMEIAGLFDGEIIAADSRTVYRGMDIGTAKPSAEDRARTPHHLIDVVSPDELMTVAGYKPLAGAAIDEVLSRGKLPILVGGTGLYVDSVIYDFSLDGGRPDEELRNRLQQMTVEELQAEILREGLQLPNNPMNPRHLIRQLERGGLPVSREKLRQNTLVLGVQVDPGALKERIIFRVDEMLRLGLENEARVLFNKYGPECQPLQTIGYQEFREYFAGRATIDDVREAMITHTLQYAKRQRTWFRRNSDIQYICKKEQAVDLVTTFLNKVSVAG
ncbi:MAG TPA: tRNA (adenosine(37)-N6)-dimethylallyltransferase MiaA [Candidatus Saccharimonadales bacterium]